MLKDRYPVAELCREMNVNRSGYYKWAARKGTKNQYEKIGNFSQNCSWKPIRSIVPMDIISSQRWYAKRQDGCSQTILHINAANMQG